MAVCQGVKVLSPGIFAKHSSQESRRKRFDGQQKQEPNGFRALQLWRIHRLPAGTRGTIEDACDGLRQG